MPLTDVAIRKAKPKEKPYKLADGGGLFVLINPSGSKWWRLKYRIQGKEKLLSLGTYPDTSLTDARGKRDEARKLLAAGADPGEQRKASKAAGADRAANSFEVIAREWLAVKQPEWTSKQFEKERDRLQNHAFPRIGGKPIAQLGVSDIRPLLTHQVSQGHIEQAHRLRHQLSRVFRFAVATERAERDPAADLRDTLPARNPKNHPTITDPSEVGELMRAMEGFTGTFSVRCAFKLAPLWFCRPGEIRMAEWSHFDLDGEHPTYKVPPAIRKLKKAAKENPATPPHIIPLSAQAIAILHELRLLTGHGRYLFPGARDPRRHMSDGAINAALSRIGYKGIITGHGFRHMARTLLAEQGWGAEALERQLSHKEQGVVGVYNKAQHLAERRQIMQAWADYLDALRVGGQAVALKSSAG
ncbi:tyrosine-type recombinase/integrase [Dyella kyungheensis]|uniref:Integrase arm-type DNA-binding domain-containing protein n=1 Tax=Dyella kyungheensis TaxID=1242174 RepID=A0ABS2JP62_9GAMM|nr:integrase arm-type DNA-binding domain-containing protein [Dyella kyungheensis]MBM7120223.1 integrase arm-type DNA-binding domain-containing protein [Dyella kyungheensis]